MRFGSRGPSECFFSDTPPKCLDRDCVGRRRTGTRHGNVYRRDREKQGIVVYQQRVLQTVTSLGVVSLVFRRHDLLKIANFIPQQEARFSRWKKFLSGISAVILILLSFTSHCCWSSFLLFHCKQYVVAACQWGRVWTRLQTELRLFIRFVWWHGGRILPREDKRQTRRRSFLRFVFSLQSS